MVGRKGLEPSHPKILVPKTYAFKKILTYYPFLYFTIATNATSATMCATSISMKFAKWTAI